MQQFENAEYKKMFFIIGSNDDAFVFCKSLCLLLSLFGSLADHKACFLPL